MVQTFSPASTCLPPPCNLVSDLLEQPPGFFVATWIHYFFVSFTRAFCKATHLSCILRVSQFSSSFSASDQVSNRSSDAATGPLQIIEPLLIQRLKNTFQYSSISSLSTKCLEVLSSSARSSIDRELDVDLVNKS